MKKDINISKRIQSKDVFNCLLDNYSYFSSDWVYHQWNWLHQNYSAFNDLVKYFVAISLVRNTLRFYDQNGFKYNYEEYYARNEIQIGEFNISELAKEFELPKETMRRKVLELEKSKVIRKEGKKIIFNRSNYNLIKPINQIRITSKYISKLSELLFKQKIIHKQITEEEVKTKIQNDFSKTWLWFYEFQLPLMISWKKFFEDIHILYIWGTLGLNQVYNQKNKSNLDEIESIVFDEYLEALLADSGAGLNIMSISEMTKIPRATVIRKMKYLEDEKLVKMNKKKQYYLSDFTPFKVSPLIKKHFKLKSDFIAKIMNLILVEEIS
jgi:DNA-binding Lrp family transcriptional regulator